MVLPQNGRRRTAAESGHEAPLLIYPFCLSTVREKGYITKENSLSIYPFQPRSLPMYLSDKKDDDIHFIRVLQCFFSDPWPY